jgi:hypothetical protein
MCGCGRSAQPAAVTRTATAANREWAVTLPDGTSRVVKTEIAAKLIVGATPGAAYTAR